jgi:hypothetical protein
VHHLGAEEAVLDLGTGAHAHAFGQLLDLAAVEIHEAQQQLAGFVGDRHEQLAPRFQADFVLGDDALDLRHMAAAQAGLADRHDLRLVLVAHRQVQDEVHVAAQAELGELALCRFRGGFRSWERA